MDNHRSIIKKKNAHFYQTSSSSVYINPYLECISIDELNSLWRKNYGSPLLSRKIRLGLEILNSSLGCSPLNPNSNTWVLPCHLMFWEDSVSLFVKWGIGTTFSLRFLPRLKFYYFDHHHYFISFCYTKSTSCQVWWTIFHSIGSYTSNDVRISWWLKGLNLSNPWKRELGCLLLPNLSTESLRTKSNGWKALGKLASPQHTTLMSCYLFNNIYWTFIMNLDYYVPDTILGMRIQWWARK